MEKPAEKIIVALDVASGAEALRLVEKLQSRVSWFKIGLQLYTACGPEIVREIRSRGARVFLDLKLHDIPNTVAGAVSAASALDVQMLTIHLSGGSEMIRAAVEARKSPMLLLGVTVLTSATNDTLRETCVSDEVASQVLRLAGLGVAARVDGLVTSPHELQQLRARCGNNFTLVVPGVRPAGSDAGDQKRFMTPRAAIDAGADYLVIGRPITAAPDPAMAAAQIIGEIDSA